MLKIIADQNIYKLNEFITDEIQLHTFNPKDGLPLLDGYDVLFVRTVTPLNRSTISEVPSSLKVIGTASAGSDHIDREYFEEQGVKVYDAKGCNANAVSEYVITALLLWAEKMQVTLANCTVGIIGYGHTGKAVAAQLHKFGIPYISYDPPLQQIDSTYTSATLNDLLKCDILTFHVPLTRNIEHATEHFLNDKIFSSTRFKLIINAARGGVIQEEQLRNALEVGRVSSVVIDVWDQEPNFNTELAKSAFIATPHIAGYSEQAKLNASKFLVNKLYGNDPSSNSAYSELYSTKKIKLADLEYDLEDLLTRLNPILEYDAALRDLIGRTDRNELFSKLRTDRPYRHEYPYLEIEKAPQLWRALLNTLSK